MPRKHIVKQGDCLLSVARQYFFSDWKEIWNAPENDAIREQRVDHLCLSPGDEIMIPETNRIQVTMNRLQVVQLSRVETFVYTDKLIDKKDQPMKQVKYEILLPNQEVVTGETDEEGNIREKLPLTVFAARLTIWPLPDRPDVSMTQMLRFGWKDPIETISGQQERLGVLGYYKGPINNKEDDLFLKAKKKFAMNQGLEEGFTEEQWIAKLKNATPNVES